MRLLDVHVGNVNIQPVCGFGLKVEHDVEYHGTNDEGLVDLTAHARGCRPTDQGDGAPPWVSKQDTGIHEASGIKIASARSTEKRSGSLKSGSMRKVFAGSPGPFDPRQVLPSATR